MNPSDSIAQTLACLEAVLADERRALRALDRDAIEALAARKVVLELELRERSGSLLPEHMATLKRVRHAALGNQLLLVHARAAVQSVLSMVGGEGLQAYPGAAPPRTAPEPLRVSVRG